LDLSKNANWLITSRSATLQMLASKGTKYSCRKRCQKCSYRSALHGIVAWSGLAMRLYLLNYQANSSTI